MSTLNVLNCVLFVVALSLPWKWRALCDGLSNMVRPSS